MIRIAIDGPGGAGKSSVARALALELGILYMDTGALYRNIGLYMLDNGINPKDKEAVTEALSGISLELKFENGRQIILLNGENRGDDIRTPAASMAASDVSAIPSVREFLLEIQRSTAKKNSVIMDGRDIGTVILPDAEIKIFLTASAEARARRRFEELAAKGISTTYETVYSEMVERDKNDSTRDIAPCVKAEDAILVDNSELSAEQTTKKIRDIVKKYQKKHTTTYMKLYKPLAPFFRFVMRLRPHNVENVKREGGLIICSNHISALDVLSIAATSPRQLTFIAKKELFSIPVLSSIIKMLGAVKIDRGGNDVGAIRTSVSAVQSGKAVAIFPQGHRYPGVKPETTPIKNGAAMMVYHAKCDVLPVYIQTKKARFMPFRKIDVIYGKPIPYESFGFTSGGRQEYERVGKMIFDAITELSDTSSLPDYVERENKR
ncbi:MAG: (d)CMP kinase [Clostridia bacterium]|nr:(d)CMP kinase [Clostridia bacterium]